MWFLVNYYRDSANTGQLATEVAKDYIVYSMKITKAGFRKLGKQRRLTVDKGYARIRV